MIRVVNMEHEMYNDGLYFVEQALKEENYGDKERCYRFAIVSFASSFESFINRQLKHLLEKDVTKIPNGQDLLDFLVHGFKNTSTVPRELRSIASKLNTLEAILGLAPNSLSTNEFITFDKEIIKLRNMIVHYSHSSFTVVYSELEKAANVGAKLLVDLIRFICNAIQSDVPRFYLNTKYEPIK